jgi:hypothetical protein
LIEVRWKDAPDEQDYAGAQEFCTLLYGEHGAERYMRTLRGAEIVTRRANDILRASGLPILEPNDQDSRVRHIALKMASGKRYAPLLLIPATNYLVIADGYHRVCAAYFLDPWMRVPCQIGS